MARNGKLHLLRLAIDDMSERDAEAAHADAGFDGGEFSSAFHTPARYRDEMDGVLAALGLGVAEAGIMLNEAADRANAKRDDDALNAALGYCTWFSACYEDEDEREDEPAHPEKCSACGEALGSDGKCPMACPGCGNHPGDGVGCTHPEGCGHALTPAERRAIENPELGDGDEAGWGRAH